MNDDTEDQTVDYTEEEYENGFLRWMSVIVVIAAIAGFFGLAWYAYQSGTQSISAEDVTLVQADDAPVKEAPADPGGLQFPHQDKTVYEAISDNKQPKPAAERLLPSPEEPAKPQGNTETWVNDKLKSAENAAPVSEVKPEEKNAAVESKPEEAKPVEVEAVPDASTPRAFMENTSADKAVASQQAAPAREEKPQAAKAEEKPVQKKPEAKAAPKKAEAKSKEPKPVKAAGGPAKVQLGAFRSETEAHEQWQKIAKTHGALISGYEHRIVAADLGAKGIYYRLQLFGFRDAAAAGSLCATLNAKKQPCFIPLGK